MSSERETPKVWTITREGMEKSAKAILRESGDIYDDDVDEIAQIIAEHAKEQSAADESSLHGYTLDDYMNAPSHGPLHPEWQDKPHRLIYDLVARIRKLEAAKEQSAPTSREPHDGWMNAWLYNHIPKDQNCAYFWNPEVRKMAGDWADFREKFGAEAARSTPDKCPTCGSRLKNLTGVSQCERKEFWHECTDASPCPDPWHSSTQETQKGSK